MNFISAFLTPFCVAAVFIGALFMLCPEGAMNKPLKYIISLCFLITVISAAGITVKNSDFKIDFTPDNLDSTELDLKNAEFVYTYALQKAGVELNGIEIFTNKNETGSISINKVIIYSNSEPQKINEALGQISKNIEVVVINE